MAPNDNYYGFYKIRVNEKLSLVYADNDYYNIHGYTSDIVDSTEMGTVEFIHPEDVDRIINTIDMCVSNQTKTFTCKFRIITPQGTVKHIVRGCHLIKDGDEFFITGVDYLETPQAIDLKPDAIQHHEIDSLTGALTREAFIARVNKLFSHDQSAEHSFIMLDLDGFKALNDTFGHSIGDKALVDMVEALRSVLRADDLIGRLGGDEFMICLMNIQYKTITEKKAYQICNALRKDFGENVILSGSLGITSYPQDGDTFDELYKKSDAALYRAKEIGKDNYVFYNDSMNIDRATPVDNLPIETDIAKSKRKTRMLIVNNKMAERLAIEALFSEDYFVLKSFNGKNALSLMRCYRSGIGIVILDANLNDLDGYSIVKIMQQEKELASIPVIMINEGNDPEIERKAIAAGAADFVRKPIDKNLLKIRVKNAVNRAENERLRIHNSYLQLQEDEEKQFHHVLNATGTVVFTHDWVHGVYTYDTKAKKHIKGNFDKRPLWQILLSDMVANAMDVKAMHHLVMSVAGNRECNFAKMQVRLKNPQDEWCWFKMQVIKMKDPLGLTNKVIMTFNDITKQVEAEQILRTKTECDSLTGLYNRETFFEKAAEWVKSNLDNKLIMTCFDIDNFKMINEQYSQNEGDRLLTIIGNFLKKKMKKERILCARIYADNFACLNCVEKHDSGRDFYKSLIEEVKLRYPDQEITISEGRYIIDNKLLRVSTMYDKAFYAKKHIKGRYDAHNATFNRKMQNTILLKHDVTGMMKKAISEKQIIIYFQPQYNHATGEISGAEALVRWDHPVRGMMHPDEFIPVFETNGFIYQLDEYVWDYSCAMMRNWINANVNPPHISVNVSRYDIYQKDFIEKFTSVVEKYNIPVSYPRLEITESAFSNSPELMIKTVKRLRDLGFTIEIDDFGSGYSSLNVLKNVPTDVLKLDMRFLSGKDELGRSNNILEHVISMAESIGLNVVAEGVETMEQAEHLYKNKCTFMQGYLYAKPMPAKQFEELLMKGSDGGTGRQKDK